MRRRRGDPPQDHPGPDEQGVRPARRWRAAVAAMGAAGALALGACGLPTSSTVQQGLDIGSPAMPPVRFQFEAPPRGASPEQIVRGFLAASWSTEDDFRAARAYLTPTASRGWNPRASVTVYPENASLQILGGGNGSVSLRTPQDAALDAGGRYRSLPLGSERSSTLGLSLASGEWRISSIPPDFGLWLSRFYFERAYRPFSVAYADQRLHRIVVDRRWFSVGAGLTTSLARAQLEAPPAYLAGAVRSGFPSDTRLSVGSVPVEYGRAEIDLTAGMLDVSAEQRRAAWAQALTTMRQAPGVQTVALQVSGRNLDVLVDGSSTSVPTTVDELGYTPSRLETEQVLWRTPQGLAIVDARDVGRRTDLGQGGQSDGLPSIDAAWVDVASTPDRADLAAVSTDRTQLSRWRDGRSYAATLGAGLTAPCYDRDGRTWVAGATAEGASRIWVVDAPAGVFAQPRELQAPWLDRAERDSLLVVRPAPDGQRVLIVSRRPSGLVSMVAGVLRDDTGRPVGLTEPWPIGGDVSDVTAATWVTNTVVGVLGRRQPQATIVPMLVAVGGETTALAPVPDPRRIVSVGGERGVVVISGDGHAYGRVGGGWQQLGPASEIVVPGY